MIRKAKACDLSRIAEIYVFNNRINYFPIFKDVEYSFGEMQVVSLIDKNIYVFVDKVVKGFIQIHQTEICKLYVDPCFQGEGIGKMLIEFAINECSVDHLWALEKNKRAISFYIENGFRLSGKRQFEEDTTEYLVELKR